MEGFVGRGGKVLVANFRHCEERSNLIIHQCSPDCFTQLKLMFAMTLFSSLRGTKQSNHSSLQSRLLHSAKADVRNDDVNFRHCEERSNLIIRHYSQDCFTQLKLMFAMTLFSSLRGTKQSNHSSVQPRLLHSAKADVRNDVDFRLCEERSNLFDKELYQNC